VPQNYYEITVNEAKIDWLGGGGNYEKLLKEAANEAGGNAFTVEYAGSPVSVQQLYPYGSHDLTRLRASATPPDALRELQVLGLNADPLILQLLRTFIPEPAELLAQGISEVQFYNQIANYWRAGDPFDPAGLADAIQSRIFTPLDHLQRLFAGHDKLTRLVTFISPEEMNVDPIFMENSTLPDVSNVHQIQGYRACGARAFRRCQAPLRLMLSDGRALWLDAPAGDGWCGSGSYDRGRIDGMPSLDRGWMRAVAGDGAVKFDNRTAIDRLIDEQNVNVRGGCGCELGSRAPAPGWWALVLAAVLARALARRRR
jgi:MYXO-CTERM domain-containing protein